MADTKNISLLVRIKSHPVISTISLCSMMFIAFGDLYEYSNKFFNLNLDNVVVQEPTKKESIITVSETSDNKKLLNKELEAELRQIKELLNKQELKKNSIDKSFILPDKEPQKVNVNIKPTAQTIKENAVLLPKWLNTELTQTNDWKAKITINCLDKGNMCGTVEFRKFNCAGGLQYLGKKYSSHVFEEKLEYGSCVKGCELHLSSDGYSYKEFCKGAHKGGGGLIY